MPEPPPVKLTRHADHDPSVICRPALGNGLCEPVEPDEDAGVERSERAAAG